MTMPGRTLSYGEQKDLERRIQDLKDAKGGKEVVQGVNVTAPNVKVMDRQLKNMEAILSSQGVGDISDKQRAEMDKECKLLEDDLRQGMPTWERFINSRPKDGPAHDRVVSWILKSNNDPVRQQKIRRWKTLRRHLDPYNPKASHVMYLHPGDSGI